MRRLILSAVFCLFTFATVQAEPFVILPSGDVAFNTSFTTQGVFTCSLCTGSGTNSVVFGSGANTLTLTFTGVNTTLLVGGQSVPTIVGQFEVVVSGDGFVFPIHDNPNIPLAFFQLSVTQSSPAGGTASVLFNTGSGGGTSLDVHTTFVDHLALPTGPNPTGFSLIVYSLRNFTIPNTNGVLNLDAELVAVPEPASLFLLGSGITLTLLKKRRKSN